MNKLPIPNLYRGKMCHLSLDIRGRFHICDDRNDRIGGYYLFRIDDNGLFFDGSVAGGVTPSLDTDYNRDRRLIISGVDEL
jgi:hypothetical protein